MIPNGIKIRARGGGGTSGHRRVAAFFWKDLFAIDDCPFTIG